MDRARKRETIALGGCMTTTKEIIQISHDWMYGTRDSTRVAADAVKAIRDLANQVEALREALEQIKNNPNCRHEVEAQLGEEIWKPLKGN